MTLGIVTCTTDEAKSRTCIRSWTERASRPQKIALHVVLNGGVFGDYLGTVPAFRQGVDDMLATYPEVDLIACLHDDFEILEDGWDDKVLRYFHRYQNMGLAGFGGALGLGSLDLYQKPYDPMQLARVGFRSDLTDAENHGMRSLLAERVACLDGFSQIMRRDFALGHRLLGQDLDGLNVDLSKEGRPWTVLEQLGVIHHGYDGMLGCLAQRYGWETWYIPLRGTHYGGRTAVGDPNYQAWAQTKHLEGDSGLWQDAHRIWYRQFNDVLPIRL